MAVFEGDVGEFMVYVIDFQPYCFDRADDRYIQLFYSLCQDPFSDELRYEGEKGMLGVSCEHAEVCYGTER